MRCYVSEITGRNNGWVADTIDHMAMLASNMRGIHLPFRELTKPTSLSNHAKGAGRKFRAWQSMRRMETRLVAAKAAQA